MSSTGEQRGWLKDFINRIIWIRGDLSSITAPPFILADRSAVEYPSSWAEHPDLLVTPAQEDSKEKRALLILKWYLSSLKRQQYSAGSDVSGTKKPLNPFLGELFFGEWNDNAGKTKLVSEQVSHHPPVTACFISNEEHGVQAEGYVAQNMTISWAGTVTIKQIGHAMLHLDKYDEDYLVTMPSVFVKGLLSGTPYPELGGRVYITSTSGYTSEVEFSGKSFWFGKRNNLRATLYEKGKRDKPLYEAEGQWNGTFAFKDCRTNTVVEKVETESFKPTPMDISDPSEQDPWESRRAWASVIKAIRNKDWPAVSKAKNVVEQAQRELRESSGYSEKDWEPVYFSPSKDNSRYEKLAKDIGEKPSGEHTKGVWRYDAEKAQNAKKPFHNGTKPS